MLASDGQTKLFKAVGENYYRVRTRCDESKLDLATSTHHIGMKFNGKFPTSIDVSFGPGATHLWPVEYDELTGSKPKPLANRIHFFY